MPLAKTDLENMLRRMQEIHAKGSEKSDSDIDEYNRLHHRIDLEMSKGRLHRGNDEFSHYREIESKAYQGAAKILVSCELPESLAHYAAYAARLKAEGLPPEDFFSQMDDLENAEERAEWRTRIEIIAGLLHVIGYWPWPWKTNL